MMTRRDIESPKAADPRRILIYSMHYPIIDLVKQALTHGAYLTRTATEVLTAADILREWNPQLAIIDLDGRTDPILTRIGLSRDTGLTTIPVLALTKSGDLESKLAAFAQGVDDVITLPFIPEELQARIQVMARRSLGETGPLNPVLKLGDLEIDVLGRRVCDGASELHLTGTEQGLLCLLAANAGQVVTHDEILDALWGSDYSPDSNVVGRLVYRLRAKLEQNWRRQRGIETVTGRGYRLVPELLKSRKAPARSRVSAGRSVVQGDRRPPVESCPRAVPSADPRRTPLSTPTAYAGSR